MSVKITYWELLKDPRWQKCRLLRLEAVGWACQRCGEKKDTLHVHHRYYVKGRKPWEYPDFCLEVICAECHDIEHAPLEADEVWSLEEWEKVANSIFKGEPDDMCLWDVHVMCGHLSETGTSTPAEVILAALVNARLDVFPNEPLPIAPSPWLDKILKTRKAA